MVLDGSAIKERRQALGWTQEGLRSKAGVEVRTIQRAEAGRPVASHTASRIALGLGVPVAVLVQANTKGIVDLVEMHSGRMFLDVLRSNYFVEVDHDFEAMPKHREALTSLGKFIDQNWIDPYKQRRDIIGEMRDASGVMREFECQVEANEVLANLKASGLNMLCASYTAHRDRMVYDQDGNWLPRLDQGSHKYQVALISVTDGKKIVRRTPKDHSEVRQFWLAAPYAETFL